MSDHHLHDKSKSNLRKKSRASRSQLQMRSGHSKLYSQSRSRLSRVQGDDEGDWLQAKDPIKPEDQLELTEEELNVEFTRILRADNPNAPDNIVRFSHKDGMYKQVSSVEQCAYHLSISGTMIHVESDEARRQLAKSKYSKKKTKETKETGTGTNEEVAENMADDADVADEGTVDEEEAAEDGEGEGEGDGEGEGEEEEGEAAEEEEEETEDSSSGKPLRNQFNFSERASQTQTHAFRDRGTVTEAPARATFGDNVTQWVIYDAYAADYEKQKQLKENSSKKKTKVEKKKIVALPARDLTEDQGSDWQLAANVVTLQIAKNMERMVNQNTFHEVQQDFKFWDDPSDQFKEKQGSVLPLWRFTSDAAKKKTITCLDWCSSYPDLVYATLGSYDYTKQTVGGAFVAYSLKNPSYPEVAFNTPIGAMCFDINQTQTSLVVVGFYDGSVAVYDISRKEKKDVPVVRSTATTGKHTDPVWQVTWHDDDVNQNHNFSSVSSDGRVTTWTMVKTELQHIDIVRLALDKGDEQTGGSDPLFGLGSGTCIAFNREKKNMFLIGTEEGNVHQCSKAYSSKFLKSFKAHTMSVYAVGWNFFHPRIFATCSADWSLKIWDDMDNEPVFSFDLGNAVGDVAWSPYSPFVFAAVTTDGKIHVFDLSQNKYEPMCVQQLSKKAKPTHISFNPKFPVIVVGDNRGSTSVFKLSPNLRKLFDEKKKKTKDQLIMLMDKLLESVKETPHVPAATDEVEV
eukprot:m.40885 g.40885  ORF g.40885 m.40885 type:complete len:741 (+) comp10386_c1_seq1:205-2427(+)